MAAAERGEAGLPKTLMWSLITARVTLPAIVVAIAAAVGTWLGWSLRDGAVQTAKAETASLRADYQAKLATGEATARRVLGEAEARKKDADHAKDLEIVRLRNRPADTRVIRVCSEPARPVPAPDLGAAGPRPGDGAAGGVLPGPTAEDIGAFLNRELTALALEADEVSAELRRVVRACR